VLLVEMRPPANMRGADDAPSSDPALLILGRALAADSMNVVHARAKGKGGERRCSLTGGNPLSNVRMGPPSLVTLCQNMPRQVISAWDSYLLSPNVRISAGGLAAWHTDPNGDELYGIVFGNAPIPRFAEGAYFEVAVDETRAGEIDGLAIGVTTLLPEAPSEVPQAADVLPNSWSYGYDSSAKVKGSDILLPIDWNPVKLRPGDSIGLLIPSDGRPLLFINGNPVPCKLPGHVPVDCALYGFVDLIGATRAVTLLPEARPPSCLKADADDEVSATAIPKALELSQTLSGFHRQLFGRCVEVLPSGFAARHADPEGDQLHGIVFCNAHIPRFAEGSYFEVRIDCTRAGNNFDDGLVIGVTTVLPALDSKLPEVADTLPHSWSYGYDGEARTSTSKHMVKIGWNPRHLKPGDFVGLNIRPFGKPQLVLNRRHVIDLPGTVPPSMPLYGFVDLLGGTTGVTLMVGAMPPDVLRSPRGGRLKLTPRLGDDSKSCLYSDFSTTCDEGVPSSDAGFESGSP